MGESPSSRTGRDVSSNLPIPPRSSPAAPPHSLSHDGHAPSAQRGQRDRVHLAARVTRWGRMAMLGRLGLLTFAAVSTLALASCGDESDPIKSAGSSTDYPFTKAVSEAFVQAKSGRRAPIVESTGTQPGIMRFCEGA